MRNRPKKDTSSNSNSNSTGNQETTSGGKGTGDSNSNNDVAVVTVKRSSYAILALFVLAIYGAWGVYHYQFDTLPSPMSLQQVGKRGFSEHEAMKHVQALTQLGPHSVGSESLERAINYVANVSETIKASAHWEVDVEVDLFHVKSGFNGLVGGLFKGKSLVYSDLNHVVLRITPKYASEAGENAILVSSHIDTVFAGEGAGDCSSCVAVMLELARGVSQWAHGFKNSVIFLFNTGEEEGLNGAHSFISQHPWSDTVRVAVDLEAIGIGGKSGIFQAGPNPWAIENYASVSKYPSAQIAAQDVFTSGAIKSATDFQVYQELAGLSGLDFAYADNTAVYHTKNDKLSLLKPGSLQHLGENMLAFLLHAGASSTIPKESDTYSSEDKAIYFDILGMYMITFRQRLANMLYNSVIMQSLLIWTTSVLMGGYPAAISLALSILSIVLMWIFSVVFSVSAAFVLPLVSSSSPMPFVASPWLVVFLYGGPALVGALTGQHIGYRVLESYLARSFVERKRKLPASWQSSVAKLDAERWIYKAGLLQWLVLLMVGNYFRVGSSYLAFAWLISPAFAYGLLEATLSPSRLPRQLKTVTLLVGSFVPFVLSSGMVIRLVATLTGTTVRLVRNPGTTPDWMGNAVIAVFIAAVVCLTFVYLLSYIHISGAKMPIIITASILFLISLAAVWGGVVPPFTEDTARAVNVVHVVDATKTGGENIEPVSYISLFSTTPGNLIKEANEIGEGFVCGKNRHLDFVTFYANYSCWTNKNAEKGWLNSDIPTIQVDKDLKGDNRETQISIDTKDSTRWSLGINTIEIEEFQLKDAETNEELIPLGEKSSVDGWHIIQFSGGRNSPTKFKLSIFWLNSGTQMKIEDGVKNEVFVLKLRTDVDKLTPPVETVLRKLPEWCSLFGKSTSPHTLAFLSSLPISF